MTRLLRSTLLLAALVSTLVVPAVARAATVEDCQAAFTTLATQTDASTFVGKQAAKEEAGLLGKLAAASETLAAGKLESTVTKLTDFRLHVKSIGTAGKLNPTDAAALVAGADAAVACVQSIGA